MGKTSCRPPISTHYAIVDTRIISDDALIVRNYLTNHVRMSWLEKFSLPSPPLAVHQVLLRFEDLVAPRVCRHQALRSPCCRRLPPTTYSPSPCSLARHCRREVGSCLMLVLVRPITLKYRPRRIVRGQYGVVRGHSADTVPNQRNRVS